MEESLKASLTKNKDTILSMSKLMDDKFYPDISEAVYSKNEERWSEICKEAGLSKDMTENLWKIAMARGVVYGNVWFVPPFKKDVLKEVTK